MTAVVSRPNEDWRKNCTKCGELKTFAEFSRNRTSKDGRHSQCKECDKAYQRQWNKANREKHNASRRRWLERGGKEIQQGYVKAFRKRNPHLQRAAHAVTRALRNGVLVRPAVCERCDIECKPQAHHDDYSKQLDVMWLCPVCHRARHAELRAAGIDPKAAVVMEKP